MHHATRVRNDPTLTRAGRQAIIGDAIFFFRKPAVARDRDTVTPTRAYYRSHDATHPHPNRQSTVYRRTPVRRELARARRREWGRCVRHRHRARSIEATYVWRVEHAAGWADDATGTAVVQDEHVGRPTARRSQKRCRIQVVGGNALASLASPPERSGRTRPTCATCQVGRFTSHHRNAMQQHDEVDAGRVDANESAV